MTEEEEMKIFLRNLITPEEALDVGGIDLLIAETRAAFRGSFEEHLFSFRTGWMPGGAVRTCGEFRVERERVLGATETNKIFEEEYQKFVGSSQRDIEPEVWD